MDRRLSLEERQVVERFLKASDDWRANRWFFVISGALSIGLAAFLYFFILEDLSESLSGLYAATSDDKQFFSVLTALVVSLSVRISGAFIAAAYGAYGLIIAITRWNGSPASRLLDVIARRELD